MATGQVVKFDLHEKNSLEARLRFALGLFRYIQGSGIRLSDTFPEDLVTFGGGMEDKIEVYSALKDLVLPERYQGVIERIEEAIADKRLPINLDGTQVHLSSLIDYLFKNPNGEYVK